jgi:uncharacterized protein YhdP
LRRFLKYIINILTAFVAVFSISSLFFVSKLPSVYFINILADSKNLKIQNLTLETHWHLFKPIIEIERLNLLNDKESAFLEIENAYFEFNLLHMVTFKPFAHISIDQVEFYLGNLIKEAGNRNSYIGLLKNSWTISNIHIKHISLYQDNKSTEPYFVSKNIISRIRENTKQDIHIFLEGVKQNGKAELILEGVYGKGSFNAYFRLDEIDANYDFFKKLCKTCPELGKLNANIWFSFLDKDLVSLDGFMSLQKTSLFNIQGDWNSSITLTSSVKPAFIVSSNFTDLSGNLSELPHFFLSGSNNKINIDLPKINLGNSFISNQLDKIFPGFSDKYALQGFINNLNVTKVFKEELAISGKLEDTSLEGTSQNFLYEGLSGDFYYQSREALFRIDSPSLSIKTNNFFDEHLILNNISGLFFFDNKNKNIEIFNNKFKATYDKFPINGKFNFTPSSIDTLGDLSITFDIMKLDEVAILNLFPNLKATEPLKSWINANVDCGLYEDIKLLYRGPLDYLFLDTSSAFQMQSSIADACLAIGKYRINKINGFLEIDNSSISIDLLDSNFLGSLLKGKIQIYKDIELYKIFLDGSSSGPFESIARFYSSATKFSNFNNFKENRIEGKHQTSFNFSAPLFYSMDILGKDALLILDSKITDAGYVSNDLNYSLNNMFSNINFSSADGFKDSYFSAQINSVPLQFNINTVFRKKSQFTLVSTEKNLAIRKIFPHLNFFSQSKGSSDFKFDLITSSFLRNTNYLETKVEISTNLRGTMLKGYEPFVKTKEEKINFKINLLQKKENNYTELLFSYGDLIRGKLNLKDEFLEGYLIAGKKKQNIIIEEGVVSLMGTFNELDIAKLSKYSSGSKSFPGTSYKIKNLLIKKTKLSSLEIKNTTINMNQKKDEYRFIFSNSDFKTSLIYNNRSKNLFLDSEFISLKINGKESEGTFLSLFNNLSIPMKFKTDSFSVNNKEYGSWSFDIVPGKKKLLLDNLSGRYDIWEIGYRLKDTNSFLSIDQNILGWTTTLETKMKSMDSEKVIKNFELNDLVNLDNLSFYPALSWKGLPNDFDLNQVQGLLGFEIEGLEISDKEEGYVANTNMLRLISIFNITDTFEKITNLNFKKLYKSGFEADSAKGSIAIGKDSYSTHDPIIFKSGSSEFKWIGTIEKNEAGSFGELDFEIIMTLPLREYLPAYALLLGGPITAGIVYIAGKAFKRNLDKLSSGRWSLTGTLQEPKTNFEGWFEERS